MLVPLQMIEDRSNNSQLKLIKTNQLKSNMTLIYFSFYGILGIIIKSPLGPNLTLEKEFTVQIAH